LSAHFPGSGEIPFHWATSSGDMMAGTVDPKAGEVQLQGKRFHAQKTAGCWGGEL